MFDINTALGRDRTGSPRSLPDVPAFNARMDRNGIHRSLAYHVAAREIHPSDGNRLLMDAIAGSDRIVPCWAALPDGDETGSLQDFGRALKKAGIKAVRLFPRTFHFSVDSVVLGPLFELLESKRIAVLVDWEIEHWSRQYVDWRALDDLAGQFPSLPIILTGMTVGQTRGMRPVLSRHKNLHVETSAFQLPDGPAWLVSELGPERVLLGTKAPWSESMMPIHALLVSSMSDKERAAVAGGNACRLLGLTEDTEVTRPVRADDIFDAHVHFGKWAGTYTPYDDADGLIREMDRCGVRKAGLVDLMACGGEDELGNARAAEAVKRFPDRLIGYATVSPHNPDAGALLAKCLDDYGFLGLKFHCNLHACPLTSDRYTPHWEIAHARKLPILCHAKVEWDELDEILDRYHDAAFIHAHTGAAYKPEDGGRTVSMAETHDNYYMGLAGSAHADGALENLVDRIGADRVIYGSDGPLLDFGYEIGRVLGAGLEPDEQRLILHENAVRLFHL